MGVENPMAVYLRRVNHGSPEADIQKVYALDDATSFDYIDSQRFRQKAFERWHDLDWALEKQTGNLYRISAR
ncbi:MAG: hypothetical protein NVS9B14_10770 [Candidatus Acidiferrum sp.]